MGRVKNGHQQKLQHPYGGVLATSKVLEILHKYKKSITETQSDHKATGDRKSQDITTSGTKASD